MTSRSTPPGHRAPSRGDPSGEVVAAARPLVIVVSLHTADGSTVERIRVGWTCAPTAADLLREVAGRAAAAHALGLRLVIDQAPPEVIELLHVAGLGRADRRQVNSPGRSNAANSDGSRK